MYPPDWDMFAIKGEWGDKAETMGVNQDRLRAAGPYHLVQQIHFQESAHHKLAYLWACSLWQSLLEQKVENNSVIPVIMEQLNNHGTFI